MKRMRERRHRTRREFEANVDINDELVGESHAEL